MKKTYTAPELTVLDFKIGVYGDYGNPTPRPYRFGFNVFDGGDNTF